MPQFNVSNTGSLPKQFVIAMKTLFDIMDDDRTGFVKLADIENRWRDNGAKGLPKGVIECLRNITPHDGLLSFDRFCSGLKICLLKNQEEHTHFRNQSSGRITASNPNIQLSQSQCPPSKPTVNALPHFSSNWPQKKPVLPTNETDLPITNYPQMLKEGNGYQLDNPEYYFSSDKFSSSPHIAYAPPKPPRTAMGHDKILMHSDHLESQERLKLRIGQTMNDINTTTSKHLFINEDLVFVANNRGAGDGKPATSLESRSSLNPTNTDPALNSNASTHIYQKKANVRRREPRRHTLQNGVDYNMLKRMKKIEHEKDILIQGLSAVEKARDWYLKQLEKVQEKIRFLGRMGSHMEQWTEAQQERLELQRARIFELNRQLEALTESSQKGGLSLHMNLALSPQQQNSNSSSASNAISRLQQQNHILNEDILKKRERISMLEGEKSSLIRELLQLRSQGNKTEIF